MRTNIRWEELLQCNAVFNDVALHLIAKMKNVSQHKAIIDESDQRLMFSAFNFTNISKNPQLLLKKLNYDILMIPAKSQN